MRKEMPTYEELEKKINELEDIIRKNTYTTGSQLTESRQSRDDLLTLFIKHSPIYAYIKEVTPSESRVMIASENYIDMIGVTGSEMVNKTMEELFPPEFAAKITADDWMVVSDGRELKLDEELNGRSYTTIKYPIYHQGKNLLAGYTIDLTELKQAQRYVIIKNEELLKLVAEKDKFFSVIAHDLRSPFTALLGFTQMLVEDLAELGQADVHRIALILRNTANSLYSLLENLLEWSRIQRGITSFEPTGFELQPKIYESLESVMESANKKGIEIGFQVPAGQFVFADPNMVSSTIRNLVSNAVKYTAKGGKILVSSRPVSGNFIEISIRDNGIGMNQLILDKLFRLDEHPSRKGTEGEPSTGLGLIICKDFTEKNGGKIWAESQEGKGSIFHFTVPQQPENLPDQ